MKRRLSAGYALVQPLYKRPFIVLAIGLFAAVGVALLLYSQAATNGIALEAETGNLMGTATVVTDTTSTGASNDSWVLFAAASPTPSPTLAPTPTPPPIGERPTRSNTGPRYALSTITADTFYTTRTCDRQRINDDVRIDQQWMKGQTFTLTDCEIAGSFWIYIQSNALSLNEMPIINMDYVYIQSGSVLLNAAKWTANHTYVDSGSQWSLDDVWAPFISGAAPISFSNSVFYGQYHTQPTHAEPLHVGDYGSGYRFTNVAFLQQSGPLENTGITGTINFHGMDTIFDGCWFVWEDPNQPPAYITAYLDAGGTSVVRNSKFHGTQGGYVYNASTYNPIFENNTNLITGAAVTGP